MSFYKTINVKGNKMDTLHRTSGIARFLKPTRRSFLAAAGAASALPLLGGKAFASIPTIRYATGGGMGPNEIETIIFMDWMRENVLSRYGKEYVLDVVYTRGTPEAASLIAAGQVDIATLSYPILATSIHRGAIPGGVTAIADIYQAAREGFRSNDFVTLADSPIQGIKDLEGKTVGVNAFGSSTELVLRVALTRAGVDVDTVRIVEVSFPSMAAAIREKRIDVGILVLPFSANEMPKGDLRPVFNERSAFGPYSVIFQAASNDFLEKQPDAVRAYLADYVDGLHWLYDPANREKAIELTAELTKAPKEVVDSYFLTENDYYRDRNGCIDASLLQGTFDAMHEFGLLPAHVDAAPHVDASYLPFPCGN